MVSGTMWLPGTSRPGSPSVWLFLLWAALGAGSFVALLTPFTIGIVLGPLTVAALIALLAWHRSRNGSCTGLLAGAGLVPLYVSYLNRSGQGEVCSTTGTRNHCVTEWSPWPWLVAGMLMGACGVALFLWLRSRTSARKEPP